MGVRKIYITFLIAFILLSPFSGNIKALDMDKAFTIYSPDYVEKLVYISQEPPFKISAPKGWYLLIKKEDSPDYLKTVFCKYDPSQTLKKGFFETPFIEISFLPNPEEISAIDFAKNITSRLKEEGVEITTLPKIIKVDNKEGSYFSAPHSRFPMIIEGYIFVSGKTFITLKAFFGKGEYEENKKTIQETVNSITFSSY